MEFHVFGGVESFGASLVLTSEQPLLVILGDVALDGPLGGRSVPAFVAAEAETIVLVSMMISLVLLQVLPSRRSKRTFRTLKDVVATLLCVLLDALRFIVELRVVAFEVGDGGVTQVTSGDICRRYRRDIWRQRVQLGKLYSVSFAPGSRFSLRAALPLQLFVQISLAGGIQWAVTLGVPRHVVLIGERQTALVCARDPVFL